MELTSDSELESELESEAELGSEAELESEAVSAIPSLMRRESSTASAASRAVRIRSTADSEIRLQVAATRAGGASAAKLSRNAHCFRQSYSAIHGSQDQVGLVD